MTKEFDIVFKQLIEDAAAPAGAMSSGPIVAASINDPGSKEAVFVLAKPNNAGASEPKKRWKSKSKGGTASPQTISTVIMPTAKRSALE